MDVDYVSFVFGGLVAVGGEFETLIIPLVLTHLFDICGFTRNNCLRKSPIETITNCWSIVRSGYLCRRLLEFTEIVLYSE